MPHCLTADGRQTPTPDAGACGCGCGCACVCARAHACVCVCVRVVHRGEHTLTLWTRAGASVFLRLHISCVCARTYGGVVQVFEELAECKGGDGHDHAEGTKTMTADALELGLLSVLGYVPNTATLRQCSSHHSTGTGNTSITLATFRDTVAALYPLTNEQVRLRMGPNLPSLRNMVDLSQYRTKSTVCTPQQDRRSSARTHTYVHCASLRPPAPLSTVHARLQKTFGVAAASLCAVYMCTRLQPIGAPRGCDC